MILKMELTTYLTSQLQLSSPEAALKDRSCGCDVKANRPSCLVPSSRRDCTLRRFFFLPKELLLGCFGLFLLLIKGIY